MVRSRSGGLGHSNAKTARRAFQILLRSVSASWDGPRETEELNRKERENLGGKDRDPLHGLDSTRINVERPWLPRGTDGKRGFRVLGSTVLKLLSIPPQRPRLLRTRRTVRNKGDLHSAERKHADVFENYSSPFLSLPGGVLNGDRSSRGCSRPQCSTSSDLLYREWERQNGRCFV